MKTVFCVRKFNRSILVTFLIVVLFWVFLVSYYLQRRSTNSKTLIEVWRYNSMKRAVFHETDGNVVTPIVRTEAVDCRGILNNDQTEIKYAMRFMKIRKKTKLTPVDYIQKTNNCSQFLSRRNYIRKPLTKEKEDFPIAYSIVIYKDIEQFERLLRAIYRPQNYYCIHVDKKSPRIFHHAVQGITDCFPNVFIASTLVDVRWAEFTVLEADLICMKDLWKRYKNWKYFINLTGQEFPLRTNNELVDVLKNYNGTADVRTTVRFNETESKQIRKRILYKYYKGRRRRRKLKQLPYDIILTKGQCHVVLPRQFIDYIFQSWLAKDFLEWLRHTRVPDETFIPTLNNSPQLNIPGAYTGDRPRNARYKNWGNEPCHGKIVRGICINGIGDLHFITKQAKLFVNKFHIGFQYLTLDCMEEWFYNRTKAYYEGGDDVVFNLKPYMFYNENK